MDFEVSKNSGYGIPQEKKEKLKKHLTNDEDAKEIIEMKYMEFPWSKTGKIPGIDREVEYKKTEKNIIVKIEKTYGTAKFFTIGESYQVTELQALAEMIGYDDVVISPMITKEGIIALELNFVKLEEEVNLK